MTANSVAIIITIILGVCGIIGAIIKAQTWLLAKLQESTDVRVQTHLMPLLEMLKKLDGEAGDESRGIPERPGILQRQTATERHAIKIDNRTLTLETKLAELTETVTEMRAVLQRVSAQFDRNGGSSMRDALDATRTAAEAAAAANGAPSHAAHAA